MISQIRSQLEKAGYGKQPKVVWLGLSVPVVLAAAIHEWLRVPGLSFAVAVGMLAFEFEYLLFRASRRQRRILECWPIVVESLESAASAGMSLVESLRDLAESEQLEVSADFAECCMKLDSGVGFDQAVLHLKGRLASPVADFTFESMRIAHSMGSAGYVSALKNQAAAIRAESSLSSELAAKQGWVVGTAKLAVLAPWLIVLILSFRPENAQLYASLTGTFLLMIGLVASAVALLMVYRIGNLAHQIRVLA